MKKIISMFICAYALLVTQQSFAGSWTPWVTITDTYLHNGAGRYANFFVSGTSMNPDGCASGADFYGISKQGNPMFVEIYSAMLAAQIAGKRVHFWIEGCSWNGRPDIQHARVES